MRRAQGRSDAAKAKAGESRAAREGGEGNATRARARARASARRAARNMTTIEFCERWGGRVEARSIACLCRMMPRRWRGCEGCLGMLGSVRYCDDCQEADGMWGEEDRVGGF